MADDARIPSDVSIQGKPEKVCKGCGSKFSHGRSDRQFCSQKCGSDYFLATYRAKTVERRLSVPSLVCPNCSVPFKVKRIGQKYCSNACAKHYSYQIKANAAAEARAKHRATIPERHCAECGNPFLPTHRVVDRQKYCSAKCATNHHVPLYVVRHRAKVLARQKKYRESKLRDKEYARRKAYEYWNTPRGKLKNAICCAVRRCVVKETKAGRRTFALLGYSIDELKAHLERQFKDGMSWANYGEWHIDHRVPLSFFEFQTPDCVGFKLAWSIKNLQPLWAVENVSKRDRLPPPDQLEMYLRELHDGLGRPYQACGFVGGQP